MEYLMTYGWAILIIAVVLAALFSLGVFNQGALLGTSCIGAPGYLCTTPLTLSGTTGAVTFAFGQSTGATAYNVILACVSTSNSVSASSLNYNSIFGNGLVVATATVPTAIGNTVNSGTQLTITNLPCYTASGSEAGTAIGQPFTGIIWMAYNTVASGGATQYAKVGTFSARTSS
jgi:hypothetical protein